MTRPTQEGHDKAQRERATNTRNQRSCWHLRAHISGSICFRTGRFDGKQSERQDSQKETSTPPLEPSNANVHANTNTEEDTHQFPFFHTQRPIRKHLVKNRVSVCVCVCSMICVHERVSNPSVGQRLYTEPWEFGGGPPALTLSLRAPSCNQGHIDQLPWPAAFPPHISLINRCDVHPVVSSPLTHTKHTHTAHAKSNNFQLLVGYRLQGGQA